MLDALIIFLSSVLIDIDHYLAYAIEKKDWNPKNAYNYLMQKRKFILKLSSKERAKYKVMIMIFHGIEFWIILSLLIFVNKLFLFVLIGVIIHMIPDILELYKVGTSINLKLSTIYVVQSNKNKIPIKD